MTPWRPLSTAHIMNMYYTHEYVPPQAPLVGRADVSIESLIAEEQTVTVCIPTTSGAGWQGRISSHFGRAPFFTLVDTHVSRLAVIPNPQAIHEHGHCVVPEGIDRNRVEAVICRGIGRNALARLRDRGIQVFVTEAETVAEGVQALEGGRLVAMSDDESCHQGDDARH